MKNYVLTGTPGCGKTTILRALELKKYAVIEEAATDLISYEQAVGVESPWKNPDFIDEAVALQKHRQIQSMNLHSNLPIFFDRSPICTYALAVYLNYKPSRLLLQEIERIQDENIYEKQVFLLKI